MIEAYKRRAVGDHSDKKEKIVKHTYDLVGGMDTLHLDMFDSNNPEERTDWHISIAEALD
jgi:hypothetical protein